jgi:hypothetical protein
MNKRNGRQGNNNKETNKNNNKKRIRNGKGMKDRESDRVPEALAELIRFVYCA